MYEIYLQSFVLYFVVIDPFGTTTIFMSLTQHQNSHEKMKSAFEGVLTATIILIFFSLVGNFLLTYLNISLGAFKIAGGIILFIISLEMLFDKRQERKEKDIENVSNNIAIFPLAIPLLSGPAAITSVIVIVSQFGDNFTYQLIGTTSLLSVMLLTLILFLIVSKSQQFINKKVTNVFSRVISIILAGLSVQYIVDGVVSLI
ncbi:MAG: MarC family protein [Pelagibacteraceae bacterium]|jgi:multiple antibiotic resistance protein|nr:MarC family protein [Pelagibacteraceae bacterium]MBT4951693.1 MarC family protein [Pelagibacteraceae bacterium]